MPETLRPKYQFFTCADLTKLRESGVETDFHDLNTAVADYVQQYLLTGQKLGDEPPASLEATRQQNDPGTDSARD